MITKEQKEEIIIKFGGDAKNTGSIQFYKKCGFVADGGSWERNFDKPLRSIRMRKEL